MHPTQTQTGSSNTYFDALIIGGGGAGLMCAIQAGRRGRRVLIVDHSTRLGGKILISGGGRCNFTNIGAGPKQYVSENPHFCKSALARFTPDDFLEMVNAHGIPYHEKKLGQLFCDHSAKDIVSLLTDECKKANVELKLGSRILKIRRSEAPSGFEVETDRGTLTCESLVVATGGLSIPKLGATGLGYQIATQFGLSLIKTSPALDGFTFSSSQIELFRDLAGVSVDCTITCSDVTFRENLLFTHSGLSGPAALQASLHWKPGSTIQINLLPDLDAYAWFDRKKKEGSKTMVKNLLSELLPSRFAQKFCELDIDPEQTLATLSDAKLRVFCIRLHSWELAPSGTVGYSKAEVTRGGVNTEELSSKTMEAKKVAGLYFIGEVVDVTGWLGGYNFQWAWASGWAAGQAI